MDNKTSKWNDVFDIVRETLDEEGFKHRYYLLKTKEESRAFDIDMKPEYQYILEVTEDGYMVSNTERAQRVGVRVYDDILDAIWKLFYKINIENPLRIRTTFVTKFLEYIKTIQSGGNNADPFIDKQGFIYRLCGIDGFSLDFLAKVDNFIDEESDKKTKIFRFLLDNPNATASDVIKYLNL